MGKAWGRIFAEEIGTTYKILTTAYEIWPGTTHYSCWSGGSDYMKCQNGGANGLQFVVGKDGSGLWSFKGGMSYTGTIGNQTYHFSLFRNGTKIDGSGVERKIGTAGDVGAIPLMGAVVLKNSTDIVDLRVESSGTTGAVLTMSHLEIFAERITTSTAV